MPRSHLLLLLICAILKAQSTAAVEGQITDPSGAVVRTASIQLIGPAGTIRNSRTDERGRYRISGLPDGDYKLNVTSPGFARHESTSFHLASGQSSTQDVSLQIQADQQRVTVSDIASQLGVDTSQSVGQLVLRGSDLDSFSDDAEDLANELQMLAGSSPGPDGGQLFIDGFSSGTLPPKASIREIRVNQNPFSAEYDRVGFGRVEVFTKPGSAQYHGQVSFDFGNRALTARNPFLTSPLVPDYRQEIFAGNFGGPLSKRASFFVDADRRITDENAIANYTALDSGFNPFQVSSAVIAPSRRTGFSPRFDYTLSQNQTLTMRYSFVQTNAENQGLNAQSFDLPSQAYTQQNGQQSLQVIESATFGARAINDARFQFFHTRVTQGGVSSDPEIDVIGAFTAGGTFLKNYTDENRTEFQDNLTFLRGVHTIKAGVRIRDDRLQQQSTSNFNGRFIFSGIDAYGQNRLLSSQGLSQAAIAALGFGPEEFLLTAGVPRGTVRVFDASVYVQDDWRVKPNLSLSGGLRYEGQSGVADHADVAPRLGIAWAPGGRAGRNPKTVIRAGAGLFYDRFAPALLMNATLLNGTNQTQYLIRNPDFYPVIPAPSALESLQSSGSHIGYRVDPSLRVPYMLQTAVGIEHQLPHRLSFAVNYTSTRGDHQLLIRDINAPVPTAFNNLGEAIGPRPLGQAAGDIYQYEGSGVFRQNQMTVSVNAKINAKFSLFGYYVYNHAMSDTDGASTLAANPYDLRNDYGRAAFDFRHRGFISANAMLPFMIRAAPFIYLQSGMPYNVTSGVDTNGDGNPGNDRPAFASNLSRSTVVNLPGFGAFDTAPGTLPNAVLLPRNYLQGPGILSLNVRISRSWSFGERRGGNSGSDEIRGGQSIQNGGLSGGSSQAGLAGITGGVATSRRYALTLTASFRNALNNVNPATPIGNLSSPYFGKSVTLNTFGPLPGAGPNAGAGNRHIELQVRLTF